MKLTVTSRGRQFDRLGLMFLGDIEVFRTSTAEPTKDGIIWTYVKEMDQYNALWKTKQKIIFDLGNLVNNIYTGTFNATLTATFFTSPATRDIADEILPISSKQSFRNQGSAFTIPSDTASIQYQLPRNIKRAVVSLSACGQAGEEFWYSNALSSETETFASTAGSLYGGSPFREVQLLIDGKLAGVSWPFPVIFTGGIAPGFWRPIVGIDAFDLREHEIDITPWLAILSDGKFHTFEIKVVGLDDDGAGGATLSKSVDASWIVSGKIFLFVGKLELAKIKPAATIDAPPPLISVHSSISQNADGANETLTYDITVTRQIRITSSFAAINDPRNSYWIQSLSYSSYNKLSAQGAAQFTSQITHGEDESSSGYRNTYTYPLSIKTVYSTFKADSFGINATLSRGLDFDIFGPSVFPPGIQDLNLGSSPDPLSLSSSPPKIQAFLSTTQAASAQYLAAGRSSFSFGTTRQDFSFNASRLTATGPNGDTYTRESYHRHVSAINATVVEDEDSFALSLDRSPDPTPVSGEDWNALLEYQLLSIRAMLGRGPGMRKDELLGRVVG